MATSRKTQIALLFGASALIAGAFVVYTMPKPEFMRMLTSFKGAEKEIDETAKTVTVSSDSPSIVGKPSGFPQPVVSQGGLGTVDAGGNYSAVAHGNATKKAEALSEVPAFDIVRIGPAGDAVIAGRVGPGKTLELLLNGNVHDRLEPRSTGTFALTPPTLPPGDHQLTLREIGPDGESSLSRQVVTVLLSPDLVSPPVIALVEPDKPTIILAGPGLITRQPGDDDLLDEDGEPTAPVAIAESRPEVDKIPDSLLKTVSIATVEAEAGRLFVSGNAPKDAAIRLYLNDTFLAAGKASAKGAFSFTIDSGITEGNYRIRLDEVSAKDGKVLSRAEVPFAVKDTTAPVFAEERDTGETTHAAESALDANAATSSNDGSQVIVPEIRTTRVEHGDSLWQISRRIYGKGTRYTIIYGANQKQIRDPDLIYPGQIFVLPGGSERPEAQ